VRDLSGRVVREHRGAQRGCTAEQIRSRKEW
jgi:hypothetical protein